MNKKRKAVSLPATAEAQIEAAKAIYGDKTSSDILLDALSLYIQLGLEWRKDADIWIQRGKTKTKVLRPFLLEKQS